jgi:hypothetical protein
LAARLPLCPSCPTLPQNTRNFFVPNFILFPSQRGNPTRLCHRYRLYNREKTIFFDESESEPGQLVRYAKEH